MAALFPILVAFTCVAAINAFIEARVRERPGEWWWLHRRWPAEVYAGLD